MRSVFIRGELMPDQLGGLLSAIGAVGQSSASYAFGDVRVVLFVGRKFTFRTNDYLGLVVLAASNGTSQRVDLSSAGAGTGLLGAQFGAGNSIETELYNALVQLLQARSLAYQDAG